MPTVLFGGVAYGTPLFVVARESVPQAPCQRDAFRRHTPSRPVDGPARHLAIEARGPLQPQALRQRAIQPIPPRPASINAYVSGSGTG